MDSEKNGNISKDFYELCYRQYEFEMKETDQIYQRVSFVLVLLSLLGTIIFKLGRVDILNQISVKIVFMYYFSIFIALACLAASIIFAILFVLPRKGKYKNLATMKVWQKWRNDYNKYFEESGGQDKKPNDALLHEITDKLAEAQANNAPINEKRRQYFYRCVLFASIGLIPVAMQAIFFLILKLKGI